jgi:hypothetical protein
MQSMVEGFSFVCSSSSPRLRGEGDHAKHGGGVLLVRSPGA